MHQNLDPYGSPSISSSTTTLPSVCVPRDTTTTAASGSSCAPADGSAFHLVGVLADRPVFVDVDPVVVNVVTHILSTSRSTGHLCQAAVGLGRAHSTSSSTSEKKTWRRWWRWLWSRRCSLAAAGSGRYEDEDVVVVVLVFLFLVGLREVARAACQSRRRSGPRAVVETTTTAMESSAVVQTAVQGDRGGGVRSLARSRCSPSSCLVVVV